MRREVVSQRRETRRLPNVGNSVPCQTARRNSWRIPGGHPRMTAGDLTHVPRNRQHECRIASPGGTPRAGNSARGRIHAPATAAQAPATAGPLGTPRSGVPAGLEDFSAGGLGGVPPRRGWRVDTETLSDRLENRKTCGVSIGSASFVPPAVRAAALVRRFSWPSSGGDRRSESGVHRWAVQRGSRTEDTAGISPFWWNRPVGEPPHPSVRSDLRNAASALNLSSSTLCAGLGSFRSEVFRSAACALQEPSVGMIHDRPPGG